MQQSSTACSHQRHLQQPHQQRQQVLGRGCPGAWGGASMCAACLFLISTPLTLRGCTTGEYKTITQPPGDRTAIHAVIHGVWSARKVCKREASVWWSERARDREHSGGTERIPFLVWNQSSLAPGQGSGWTVFDQRCTHISIALFCKSILTFIWKEHRRPRSTDTVSTWILGLL